MCDQDETLNRPEAISTKENLEKLVYIGESLLNKLVSKMYYRLITYATSLPYKYAKILSQEKRLRKAQSPHTNKLTCLKIL